MSGAEKEDVWKGKPAPPVDYEFFYDAPEYIWKQKEWTEREIEAVMVCRPTVCDIARSRAGQRRARISTDYVSRAGERPISVQAHSAQRAHHHITRPGVGDPWFERA